MTCFEKTAQLCGNPTELKIIMESIYFSLYLSVKKANEVINLLLFIDMCPMKKTYCLQQKSSMLTNYLQHSFERSD